MKEINFYGKRICFYMIILIFVSVYFSLDVFADAECNDYDEYCSGLANGGQTTAYTRGDYCYYKVEVGGKDNDACKARFDNTKKCWTTAGKRCNANEKCTATGCESAAASTPQRERESSASKSPQSSATDLRLHH